MLQHRPGTIPADTYDMADLCNILRVIDYSYDSGGVIPTLIQDVYEVLTQREGYPVNSPTEILKILKNPRHAGRKPKTDSKLSEKMNEMRRKGCTLKSIAEELGVSYSRVQRELNKNIQN